MSKLLVVGNWKMNGSQELLHQVLTRLNDSWDTGSSDVVLCPPSVYLESAARTISQLDIDVGFGGQNLAAYKDGAYTGEISGRMLTEIGCRYVIVGHSERRELFGETDEVVARKFAMSKAERLIPILCVGEKLEDRQAGREQQVVKRQLDAIVDSCGGQCFNGVVVAYEPVWAIGTGHTASSQQAQEMHAFIKECITGYAKMAASIPAVLYGGSVNPDNAAELFAMPDINGALVGGASLDADKFISICNAANS